MRLQDLLPIGGRQWLLCKHLEQALKTKEDKTTMTSRPGLRTPTMSSTGTCGTACLGLGS